MKVCIAEKPKRTPRPKAPKKEVVIEELQCPKCKSHLLKKGHTAYGCANFSACGFKLPFEILGVKLSDKHISDLLTKGKTSKVKGLVLPGSAEKRDGKLVLNGGFVVEVE